MRKVIIPLALFLSGCSGEAPRVERSVKNDLPGMTVTEVKHTATTSTLNWTVPASYEAITLSVQADNAEVAKLPALPRKVSAVVSFYTSKGGKFLFNDKSAPAILSPGQSHVFTKEVDVSREMAANIGYWEAVVGPAK